jgi:ligand-binding sensor domain-containing protein
MKKLLLFLLCIGGLYPILQAQNWQHFMSPSPYQALISNDIRGITVAGPDDIWCSTWGGGASRFSGGSWQSYTTANMPLLVNAVSDVVIDNEGATWLATYGGGIVRIDATVTNYNINSNGAFLSNMTFSATKDHQGNLWFGTDGGGALKWDGTDFSTIYMNNSGLKSNIIRRILTDHAGNMWFATWGGGLSKFDGHNWVTYTNANTNGDLRSDFIYDLTEDASGNIWMATHVAGICKFSVGNQSFEYYSYINSILPPIDKEPTNVAIDSQGNLWAGSPQNGLFELSNGTWSVFTTANSGLPSNTVNRIAFDQNGIAWIATAAGLSKMDTQSWVVYNKETTRGPGPLSNHLIQHFIDHNGHHWMITDPANISKYDGSTWTHYNHSNTSTLPVSGFTCIAEDKEGNIWLGTRENGAIKFDGTAWSIYTTGNSQIGDNYVSSIACDAQGNLWFGSFQHGLSKFDGHEWSIIPSFSNGFNARLIQSLLADNQGNLWIGTIDAGLYKFNGTAFTSIVPDLEGVMSKSIMAMTMDLAGNLWLSSPNGLLKYNIEHKNWQQFTTANSPLINGNIRTLTIDKNNNVWMGTTGGVSVFDGSQWATFVYGTGGLTANDICSIQVDAQNNKWIATAGGGLCELFDGIIDFQPQRKWFVRQNASGSGSSWADASGDIAYAIDKANAGDSIFVAAGIFQPIQDSFFILKAGVKLFGGFKGTETDFSQRFLDNEFKTVIKGNGSAIIVNYNNGLTASTVLDGFTLTQGRGYNSFNLNRGGAMANFNVSPSITDCIFEDNEAGVGGALYNQASAIYIKHCQFLNNKVTLEYNGGALYEEGSSNSYINCVFKENQAGNVTGESGAGGAACLTNTNTAFYNCLFEDNKSLGKNDGGGGAIFIDNSRVDINNCTFYGNTSTALFGTQLSQGNTLSIDPYGTGSSQVRLLNSIVDGAPSRHIAQLTANSLNINRSVIKGYEVDLNQDGIIDEQDVIDDLPYNTDPMFMDAKNSDFRLQPASPCISVGSLANFYPTDLAGNQRVENNKIDLGAFQSKGLEFFATPGQKLTSNRADTASGGVIYLYNNTENTVIVGVDPNGQDLGNIEATGSLSTNYGSGQPTTLESPFGIEGEVHCLNRSWHVTLTNPDFNNPVTVRFFIDTTDLRDLITEMPANTKLPHSISEWMDFAPLIRVYKVEGDDAYASNATNYKQYTFSENNETADLSHFIIGQYQKLFYLEFQVSEFSSGSVAYIPLATPIQLIKFEGGLKNGQASLNWQTGEEVNFKQFEIEKSTDNITFNQIATTLPTGNNSFYQYSCPQQEATAYYRLKLIDQKGQPGYSKVIKLVQQIQNFTLFPNPASDYIKINSAEVGQYYIYDATGKQVGSGRIIKGQNQIQIANLAAGMYYIRLNQQKANFIKK